MTDTDFLQQYGEAVKDSSNRTRQILLLMIIASILVFAAFWNSRSNGWISSRRTLAVAVVDMLETKARVASARLEVDDIVDARTLCVKIKGAADPVSKYVAEHLSEETQTAIVKYDPTQPPSQKLLQALIHDLNSVRKSSALYDPKRFKGRISKNTEAFIEAKEKLEEKKRKRGDAESSWSVDDMLFLNRLLLEDAFKNEIAPSDVEPLIPPAEGRKDYKELREKYEREMEYAEGKSLDNVRSYLQWVNKVRAEQLSQVHVPVLGISFDVNDLGMLGGFAFIVLLIWVNYSLWHQSTNLKLAFEFAKELEKKGESRLLYYTYRNLAMRQVLTIPPSPASDQTADTDSIKEWVQKGSKLLYALPLAVQTTIVLYDWSTRHTGWEVNPVGTNIVLFTGTLFWCLVATLTALCFYIWGRTYDTWNTIAEAI